MANIAFCIFCDSLDVTETVVNEDKSKTFYEYYCYECHEGWTDDESEYEVGV